MSVAGKYPRKAPGFVSALVAVVAAGLIPAASAGAQTCPNQAVRDQQSSSYLPECRAYELASPVNKNEQEVEGPTQYGKELSFQGAETGSSVAFTLTGAIPDSLSGGLYSEALARSAAPGSAWQVQPQNPQNELAVLPGGGPKSSGEFRYYSPDLSCGVTSTPLAQAAHNGETTPLLAPGENAEEKVGRLYRWVAGSSPAGDTYSLITSIKPSDPTGESEQPYNYYVNGASAGCAKVIYENPESVGYNLPGDPPGTLYESTEATGPRAASVLPSGHKATAVQGSLGGTKGSNIGQISADGSRVFFSAFSDGEGPGESAEVGAPEVYVRENGSTTISVSKSTTAVPDHGARFQLASADGNVVFFTANYGLTPVSTPSKAPNEVCERTNSQTGIGHCDLYRYDFAKKTLTDLSADKEAADLAGANVRGVLGASPDGSTIYFSATGQLVPGQGNTEAENEATSGTTPTGVAKTSKEANVYMYREGALAYVASIGLDEASGSGDPNHQIDAVAGDVGDIHLVSRVSTDGRFLLLATQKQLTSYDTREEGTETREWEQYEYSRESASTACVSCDPSGSRPPVNPNVKEPFGVLGLFLEVRYRIPHGLADDGRVFFDSFDPLVDQATNGSVNAYAWSPPGVGGCETEAGCVGLLDSGTSAFPSYFEDASLNGNDVYVTSQSQLAPQDTDGLRDIYDVRVDGGILYTPPPPGCSGEECQGPVGGGLAGSSHASETATGGNPPLTGPPAAGITPPEAGVKGFVHRKLSRSHRVMVSVMAPGAGLISVSGHGLKIRKLAVSKGGTYVLSVPLTAKEIKALKRKHRLRLRIHVSFVSTAGHASSTTAAVTVR
jgi:hypothetical protein